ncbi:MAG: hypothetical protein RLZZ28_2272, partial [Bacteroidota bacterium]
MNYFELYQIPISLTIDPSVVKNRFYKLSRQFHPDFVSQGTEAEQDEALEISSQVNQAYKIFQDPDATIKYVLKLKGLLDEEEKYQLSTDFLMEMMNLNELAMEATDKADKEKLETSVTNIQKE